MAVIGVFIVVMIIAFIIGIIRGTAAFFVENVIVFESILMAIIVGAVLHYKYAVHSAIAFVLSIVCCVLLVLIQSTKVGFWVLSVLLSLVWGIVLPIFGIMFNGGDTLWFILLWAIGFGTVMGLHMKARRSLHGRQSFNQSGFAPDMYNYQNNGQPYNSNSHDPNNRNMHQ